MTVIPCHVITDLLVQLSGGHPYLLSELSAGDIAAALSSKTSQAWLQPNGNGHTSVPESFQAIEKHARLHQSVADSWQQLQVAVAAFLTFTQANLTG